MSHRRVVSTAVCVFLSATVAVGTATPLQSVAPFPPNPSCLHPLATIDRWPLRARVAQLLLVGADGHNLTSMTRLANVQQIGGIVLRSAPASVVALHDGLVALRFGTPIPIFAAVDEEGGRVQTLRPVLGALPSARRLGALRPAQIREKVRAHSNALKVSGVDMVLAPDADLAGEGSDVIGDRSFGADPNRVAASAKAYAQGVVDAGLIAVVKHFPGHGSATGDSHAGRAIVRPITQLEASDLIPFRAVIDTVPVAVMVGHLEVPGLTGDTPASLSPSAISYLRATLGFRGLVITDSLSMGAITGRWREPAAAAEAIVAGVDMVMFVTISERDAVGVIDALEQIVHDKRLSRRQLNGAVLRVVRAKGLDPCSIDASALVGSAAHPTVRATA